MALIRELKQRVVHTSGCCWPRHAVGGYFRNSRENPDFQLLRLILEGRYFATPDLPQC